MRIPTLPGSAAVIGALALLAGCAGNPPPCPCGPPPPPPPCSGPGGPQWGGPGGPQMGGPGMPHRGPPPEALEACRDKKAGDECVARRGDWEMKGICRAASEQKGDQQLACTPERRGKQGAGKLARGGQKPED
jgi:hypothetical protein